MSIPKFKRLPSDLQAAIKPTREISGHGCKKGSWNSDYTIFTCTNPDNSGNNFTSTDKLYLLSSVEVFGSDDYDTAAGTTTQLEYYNNSSNSKIKQYNSSNSWWWLRSADSDACFRFVSDYGYLLSNIAYGTNGVAPAFRIG